jgi:4-carboxymuconolactone decarboxylase
MIMQQLKRIVWLLSLMILTIAIMMELPNLSQFQSTAVAQEQASVENDRFQRGLELVRRVNRDDFERGQQNFANIAPDLVRFSVEYAYGDLLSRPGLDLKSREIATVAALTALGNASPQLKFHIHGALNVGCTRQEIVEIITQLSAYVGFPISINGMNVAKEVFQERDAKGQKP